MIENIKREPVVLSVLAGNILALAVAFGIGLDEVQIAAIMGVVSTLVVVVFGRQNVTPNVDVAASVSHGEVVAGPAAGQPTGTPVQVTDVINEF